MRINLGEFFGYMTLRIESIDSYQQALKTAEISYLQEISEIRRNVKLLLEGRTEDNKDFDTLFVRASSRISALEERFSSLRRYMRDEEK